MPTIKLTRRAIADLPPATHPVTYWDASLPGFGLQDRPSGSRSWVCQYRPGAGGRGAASRRVVIGDPAEFDVERARAAARDLLARVRLGADSAGKRAEERAGATVGQIAEAWLARHVRPRRKPNTVASYEAVLRCHVLPSLGTRKAASLTRADVLRLHEGVARKAETPTKGIPRGAGKGRGRGGEGAANRAVILVKALISWATLAGLLPEGTVNPASRLELFRDRPRDRFLSAKEFGRLGEALRLAEGEGLPWAAVDESKPTARHLRKPGNRRTVFDTHSVGAVWLILTTGARLREILNLAWVDVDWERGLLRLPDNKSGRRNVVLGAPALAVLDSLPRLGRYVIASTTAGTKDEAPRRDIKKLWAALTRHAGLPGLRIHDLRHSFAAVGAGDGLSLHQIGGLLGHAQPSTTRRYAHLHIDPQRRAADLIAGGIASALGLGDGNVVDLAQRRHSGG